MTDRELLEMAAKAAGMHGYAWTGSSLARLIDPTKSPTETGSIGRNWNPLTDDGDAMRLAVKCRIDLFTSPIGGDARIVTAKRRMRSDVLREPNPTTASEEWLPDPYAATRRAVVRAAAEIGKAIAPATGEITTPAP